ncbi:MAG: EamA family transporter, partial [Thermodesulfobacteriota bacterium]
MDKFRGYIYILIGATLWGVSGAVAKSLFNIGISPAELVHIRLTLATLTLGLLLVFFDRKRMVVALKDLPYFLILGFIGVAGVQYTYYYTISKIHVGPAVLIQYLSPMWVALYAFIFQKEPFTK